MDGKPKGIFDDEKRKSYVYLLGALTTEYRHDYNHADSFTGATTFNRDCESLKEFVKFFKENDMNVDITHVKYIHSFVSELHKAYSNAPDHKVNSEMREFLDVAVELGESLQQLIDSQTTPLESSWRDVHGGVNVNNHKDGPVYKEETKVYGIGKHVSKLQDVTRTGEVTSFDSSQPSGHQMEHGNASEASTRRDYRENLKDAAALQERDHKIKNLEENLNKMSQDKEDLKSQLDGYEQQLKNALVSVREKESEINTLKNEVDKISKERNVSQLQMEECQQELRLTEKSLSEREGELETIKVEQENRLKQIAENTSLIKQQEQDIATMNTCLLESKDNIKSLNEKLEKSLKEKEEYMLRLSKEMGAKVSADESHMENISIKNRPMTVADDYHNFMADVWSDAKEKLDAEVSKMDNKDRLTLLSDILMATYEEVKVLYGSCKGKVFETLTELVGKTEVHDKAPGSIEDLMPKALQNHVGDMFRILSGSINMRIVAADVISKLKESKRHYPNEIFHQETVETYIREAAKLAWKMIVQRPQMEYSVKGVGEPHDSKTQNLHYYSAQPDVPGAVVNLFVFPCLYHGKSLMVKGTVLI